MQWPTFPAANGCNIINTAFIATGDGVIVINTGPSRACTASSSAAPRRSPLPPVTAAAGAGAQPQPCDYFGNQAWDGVPTQTLAGNIATACWAGARLCRQPVPPVRRLDAGRAGHPARQALE